MLVEKQTKSEVLRVRLTPHELKKLKAHAEKHGTNPSHIIHEYIRRLPNPEESIHHSRVMK